LRWIDLIFKFWSFLLSFWWRVTILRMSLDWTMREFIFLNIITFLKILNEGEDTIWKQNCMRKIS
jgi:hypothetical protein